MVKCQILCSLFYLEGGEGMTDEFKIKREFLRRYKSLCIRINHLEERKIRAEPDSEEANDLEQRIEKISVRKKRMYDLIEQSLDSVDDQGIKLTILLIYEDGLTIDQVAERFHCGKKKVSRKHTKGVNLINLLDVNSMMET